MDIDKLHDRSSGFNATDFIKNTDNQLINGEYNLRINEIYRWI